MFFDIIFTCPYTFIDDLKIKHSNSTHEKFTVFLLLFFWRVLILNVIIESVPYDFLNIKKTVKFPLMYDKYLSLTCLTKYGKHLF